jgi:hypothetical protein
MFETILCFNNQINIMIVKNATKDCSLEWGTVSYQTSSSGLIDKYSLLDWWGPGRGQPFLSGSASLPAFVPHNCDIILQVFLPPCPLIKGQIEQAYRTRDTI